MLVSSFHGSRGTLTRVQRGLWSSASARKVLKRTQLTGPSSSIAGPSKIRSHSSRVKYEKPSFETHLESQKEFEEDTGHARTSNSSRTERHKSSVDEPSSGFISQRVNDMEPQPPKPRRKPARPHAARPRRSERPAGQDGSAHLASVLMKMTEPPHGKVADPSHVTDFVGLPAPADDSYDNSESIPDSVIAPDDELEGAESDQRDQWSSRHLPPHLRTSSEPSFPLSYTRRIEGLIQPSEETPLQDLETPFKRPPIARLLHGLDRALFNPGVIWYQDPRTSTFNYPKALVKIPEVEKFAFDRVTGFVTSSRDNTLLSLAKREGCLYTGSTSSLTKILGQIYFLISMDKPVDISTLSVPFQHEHVNFTPGQRMPVSVILNYKDGVYSTDSDNKNDDPEQVLALLGTMLEKYLTQTPEQFATLLKSSPAPGGKVKVRREPYRYARHGKLVMRSQLDCIDSRLPGTGIFDIKTRAVSPIRMDIYNYKMHQWYELKTLHGPSESFEKEYYDLIRSAFLKYSLQVRIGNMDGVFVAYHNTARLFGFQYIPLEEMEARLYSDSRAGDRVFDKCLRMLEVVYDEIVAQFPQQTVNVTFDAKQYGREMLVWVEPREWGSYGEKPIVQLEVVTRSYLGDQEVRGGEAVSAIDQPWTLHWTISKSSLSIDEIRRNRQTAYNKQAAISKSNARPGGRDLAECDDIESDATEVDEETEKLPWSGLKSETHDPQ